MRGILWAFFLLLILAGPALSGNPGFTEEDRARLIRLEATLQTFMHQMDKRFAELREDMNKRFELMEKRFEMIDKRFEDINKRFEDINRRFEDINRRFEDMNKRFEDINKRFEQMMTFLWILTGIFVSITAVVIGFAYWDRRTIIRKAREDTVEYLEREGKLGRLIEALKELAREDRKLAEVLRSYGIL